MRDYRLTGLDFLRALACLLVFLHHTTQRLNFGALQGGWQVYYLFFNMGAFGVGIFFLLSGFLLARPFWLAFDADAPRPSLRVYALRRAARIVPGFYASLTVTVILATLVFGVPLTHDIIQRYVAGLLFVSEFHWLTLFPAEVNGPLWSIGMEVACYALLPLGLFALFALRPLLPGWRGRIVFLAVVGAALAAHMMVVDLVPKQTFEADFRYGMVGGAKYWMPQYNVAGFFVVFATGALAAGLSTLWRGRASMIADIAVIVGLYVAAWAMLSVSPDRKPEAFGMFGIPYDFPFFHMGIALALVALPHTRLLPPLTEARPIRFFARISFGIYIWHYLIIELIRQLFVPDFQYAGISNTTEWLGLVSVSFVLAIGAGTLSWYGLESPVLNWAKRLEAYVPRRDSVPAPTQKVHA